MAESILFTLAANIATKLGSFPLHELGLLWTGFHEELDKLKDTLSAIQAVLLDAEEKQYKSYAVKEWVSRLKDAFYDIDDLMDEFSYESIKRQVMIKHRTNNKQVRIFFSESNQIAFRLKMGYKIKRVREKLDIVAIDKAQFNLSEYTREIRNDETTKRPETSSFILEGEVIGRDDDKKGIVHFLLDTNVAQENVAVVAIIGMGGLGKTALAQSIYGDMKENKHFELTMLVCISEEFDVKIIVEKIIESLTKKRPEPNLQLDTLQNMLREKIDGKRYLLVMDDVWNVNREKWINLKAFLTGGAKGSRILITTRTHQVAHTSETVLFHHLSELNKNSSWELFRKMAFSNESEVLENSKLVIIGKEIVANLKGSPLALRVIGSYLYSKKTEKDWLSFKDNELGTIMQQENEIQSILKISFNQLSSGLKQCFTYCALFPKDYEIQKDDLIKQWMAQGFIQPQNKKTMEDVGDDYFKELLGRSFFQDIKKNKWGEIKEFKIHDFMHDLACSVVENVCVLTNDDTKTIDKRTRHVSISTFISKTRWKVITESLKEAKNLRTLNYACDKIDLSNHLQLRTLNVDFLYHVPKCIGKMKHLRYVNLSNTWIDFLPKFITKLYNLETLILRNCQRLMGLPSDIKNLINLRHLDIMHCNSNCWSFMPMGLGSMTSLQTMNLFVLGAKWGGELSELNGLNSLRGSLRIKQLQFCITPNLENAKYLEEKSGIQKLELHWDSSYGIGHNTFNDEDEKVLECLKPHPNLQKIRIEGYKGVKLCNWFSFGSIGSLVTIKLCECEKLKHLPQFDQFPFLKHLHLEDLPNIEFIDDNNYVSSSLTTFFPSLEKLSIIQLPKLKEWWKGEFIDQTTPFPTTLHHLSRLKINHCPQLGSIPQHGPLRSLDVSGVSLQLFELVMEMATTNIIVGQDSSSSTTRSLSSLSIWDMDFEFLQLHDLFSNMTHLKSLVIGNCKNIKMSSSRDGVIWKELGSLRRLDLCSIPELECLPKGLQYVTTLECLKLYDCRNLVSIEGIEHLTSLSLLEIEYCPNLISYPQEMGQLTSLSRLRINGCPNLPSLPEGLRHVTFMYYEDLPTPRYALNLFSINNYNFCIDPKVLECLEFYLCYLQLRHRV
uniref:CNL-I n=1 Tax=Cucumis melo TaxID=3656 RepID=A0A678Q5Q6_CUCME|nr:CNL-I [Cucumis melo]